VSDGRRPLTRRFPLGSITVLQLLGLRPTFQRSYQLGISFLQGVFSSFCSSQKTSRAAWGCGVLEGFVRPEAFITVRWRPLRRNRGPYHRACSSLVLRGGPNGWMAASAGFTHRAASAGFTHRPLAPSDVTSVHVCRRRCPCIRRGAVGVHHDTGPPGGGRGASQADM